MTPQETVLALTRHIREAVRPHLGAWHGREITGTAASGDATFRIDEHAEEAIVSFIERERLSIAYYSEDKGLIEFGASPEAVLIIDPIDGTRPAVAGFEQCVVSVAWADYRPDVTLADVRLGCIGEIKNDDLFWAERGRGRTGSGRTAGNARRACCPSQTSAARRCPSKWSPGPSRGSGPPWPRSWTQAR